jgi:hypothetical protein
VASELQECTARACHDSTLPRQLCERAVHNPCPRDSHIWLHSQCRAV